MGSWTYFLAGLFIGVILGVFMLALVQAASGNHFPDIEDVDINHEYRKTSH